jgi:hypothetical protein
LPLLNSWSRNAAARAVPVSMCCFVLLILHWNMKQEQSRPSGYGRTQKTAGLHLRFSVAIFRR